MGTEKKSAGKDMGMYEYTHVHVIALGMLGSRVLDCTGGVIPLKTGIFEQMDFFAKA